MEKKVDNTGFRPGTTIIGGLLILLGIFFMVGELFNIRIDAFVWPFFIIGPGLFIFLIALTLDEETGRGISAFGGLVTMVGLVLFYQNLTGHWESWAYAWALVAPTSIGLGTLAYAWIKGKPELRHESWKLVKVGLAIFIGAAVFFELVIGIGGFGLGRFGWPILLIALGIFLFFRNLNTVWHKGLPKESETATKEEYHVYHHS
ncbi:MAG: hypothetical protein WAM60_03655 [Candidatus Promineifilaceae bacterium]